MLKRILIVHKEHLLAAGIASLLAREADFDVVNTVFSDNHSLLDEIKKLQPSVLILNDSLQFTEQTSLYRLLINCPELRLVVVDERNNFIHVYNKQKIEVVGSDDLIAAIRAEPGWV